MMKYQNPVIIIFLVLTMFLAGCASPGGDPFVTPPDNTHGEAKEPPHVPGGAQEEPPDQQNPPENPGEQKPPASEEDLPTGGEGGGGEAPDSLDMEGLIALYSFLSYPIKGGKVSSVNGQLPNAPRSYRNGVHEGLDFYSVSRGTPVLAAAAGVVIRIDHDYVEMAMEEYNEIIAISMREAITPPKILDQLRGRQVWIEHQNGITTRYAHLNSVTASIAVGDSVEKGVEIGTVGDSGSKSGVAGETLSASGAPHLHFEIWREGRFLGQGLAPDQVRHLYKEILKD